MKDVKGSIKNTTILRNLNTYHPVLVNNTCYTGDHDILL